MQDLVHNIFTEYAKNMQRAKVNKCNFFYNFFVIKYKKYTETV